VAALLPVTGLGQACVLSISGDGFEGRIIPGIPDVSQPPPNALRFPSVDHWSGPAAAAGVIAFLDGTVGWPIGVSGNLSPEALSGYLGYFMATNGSGSPDRINARARRPGTLIEDLAAGIREFARWDEVHLHRTPPPPLVNKAGVNWEAVVVAGEVDPPIYQRVLGTGTPPLVVLRYWNPVDSGRALWISASGHRFHVRFYTWGAPIRSSREVGPLGDGVPAEEWAPEHGIGHVVVGEGWLEGDPDGRGPLPKALWLLVRDTWAATAEHVAIPWGEVLALITIRQVR
jgi:hypothetical protein